MIEITVFPLVMFSFPLVCSVYGLVSL